MPPRKLRLTPEERALRAITRMSAGTVAGRVESASPARRFVTPAAVVRVTSRFIVFTWAGTISVDTSLAFAAPFAGAASRVRANTTTNVSPDCIYNILVDGVDMFTGGNIPEISSGSDLGAWFTPDNPSWAEDQMLQVEVTQTGGASDLVVVIQVG